MKDDYKGPEPVYPGGGAGSPLAGLEPIQTSWERAVLKIKGEHYDGLVRDLEELRTHLREVEEQMLREASEASGAGDEQISSYKTGWEAANEAARERVEMILSIHWVPDSPDAQKPDCRLATEAQSDAQE